MIALNMSPDWFYGYDLFFELFFFAMSLTIALFAFKIYKSTGQKQARYFGTGFMLLSIAYFLQDLFILISLSEKYSSAITGIYANLENSMQAALNISAADFAAYTYMLLMIAGLVVILFVSLKSEKIRTLWVILIASIIAMFMSQNMFYTFYLLSSVYLAFIAWHFVEHYLSNRQTKTLFVSIAFVLLFFGTFHFLISVNHGLYYVIGQVLAFFAYLMILYNWYLLRK